MDPHPTPFPGKRRPVAAPAASGKAAAPPKPKSIATARATRIAKRPLRRAFGTIRSSNAPVDKPPPPLQKPSKLSPSQQQKAAKLSPPAMQKPSKQSPPNLVRATKPSRPAARPLKKAAPGVDLEPKAKKKSQRVNFQEATAVAAGSGEKVKPSAFDMVGHTPVATVKAAEKPSAETPFFTAQNCSSWTLDQLESATYWLAQIRLAESVGKHWVAAAFFRLAFECQAQPIHRIQSELRNYKVRHESAGTLTPLFDELLTAHGMPVNQPTFDTDGFDKVDTPLATNVVDKKLDTSTPKVDECLESDCGDDLIDVGAIIAEKHGEDCMEQPSFDRKLDESFEFDDCEAVIVDQVEEANFDLQKNVEMKAPCSSEVVQSACRSSIEKLSPRESIVMTPPSGRLSLNNPSDKLSPSIRNSSAKRLSSGSPFAKKSPLSSKRLTSSCPSYKKSASTRDPSSKRLSSGSRSDGEHNATAGAADDQSNLTQDMGSEFPASVDQPESKGPVEDAANSEVCPLATGAGGNTRPNCNRASNKSSMLLC
ncbi:hypothetical protein ACP70R_013956 [Stipagrostis hirtigluma subsp. patula]